MAHTGDVKSYGQYCPIARAAEIFAERWTPLIIRNLHLGAQTFSEIRAGAPGIPKSLLSSRLDQLERSGVVATTAKGSGRGSNYALTVMGDELFEVCHRLGVWGARWLGMTPEDYDPYIVLWVIATGLRWESAPDRRVVVAFDFVDQPARHRHFWLVVDQPEAEVCVTDPGFDNDVHVTAQSQAFVDWHIGTQSWRDAVDDGKITITGPAPLVRSFPEWNPGSHFRHVETAPAPLR